MSLRKESNCSFENTLETVLVKLSKMSLLREFLFADRLLLKFRPKAAKSAKINSLKGIKKSASYNREF